MKASRITFVLVALALGVCFSSRAETPSQPGESAPPKPAEAGQKEETGDFVTEKRSDGTTVKYKKKTSYDFEGSSIEGLYNKPSGSYISNIKDVKGRSIIRIRENFDAEVIDSSRLLK